VRGAFVADRSGRLRTGVDFVLQDGNDEVGPTREVPVR
jgi:hypothetical protein